MSRPKGKDPRTKYGTTLKPGTVKEIKQIAFNTEKNENEVIEEAISFYSKILKTRKAAEKHGKTLEGLIDEAISRQLLFYSKENLEAKNPIL